jgi:dGTP triphosphohydrolase
LYNYYINNPGHLPEEYTLNKDAMERQVTDYIAGMTDHYAILTAAQISSPGDP